MRDDVGASFSAVYNGRKVVDLWGGVADVESGEPWQEDTLQLVFSGTKGLTAICLLMLVDRGQLDPQARVSDYWPEFAAGGKERLRVEEVVSHRARLPGLLRRIETEDLLDGEARAADLAEQVQEIDPRARSTYHVFTYGWMCAEILRRIDGRSIGRFFAEEIAGPLDLDNWIGLPEEQEHRVSTLTRGRGWDENRPSDDVFAADPLLGRIWNNPPGIPPGGKMCWNRPEFHAGEIPAANGIGTARSFARLYGCLAQGGTIDGVELLSEDVLRLVTTELSRRYDPLVGQLMTFSFGFEMPNELGHFGPPRRAFGHAGRGNSIHGAWPELSAGFSYCMNQMRIEEPDPRPVSLLTALHDCIYGRA